LIVVLALGSWAGVDLENGTSVKQDPYIAVPADILNLRGLVVELFRELVPENPAELVLM
jgi:hypothetical protein